MTFGEHVKSRRLELGLSLRNFCLKLQEDPSNWSKLERGLLPPPDKYERLLQIGHYLGYEAESPEMQGFFDLASISKGKIPRDIQDDSRLMEKLPLVFRTLRDTPTEEELMRLADLIRGAHSPHAE